MEKLEIISENNWNSLSIHHSIVKIDNREDWTLYQMKDHKLTFNFYKLLLYMRLLIQFRKTFFKRLVCFLIPFMIEWITPRIDEKGRDLTNFTDSFKFITENEFPIALVLFQNNKSTVKREIFWKIILRHNSTNFLSRVTKFLPSKQTCIYNFTTSIPRLLSQQCFMLNVLAAILFPLAFSLHLPPLKRIIFTF